MAKQKSSTDVKSISQIIALDEFKDIREIAESYDVVEEFYTIFPELKKIAVPKKVEDKVLYIKVENSVWKSELFLYRKQITEKINKFFNKQILKTIKLI
jgi:hypothetical protein